MADTHVSAGVFFGAWHVGVSWELCALDFLWSLLILLMPLTLSSKLTFLSSQVWLSVQFYLSMYVFIALQLSVSEILEHHVDRCETDIISIKTSHFIDSKLLSTCTAEAPRHVCMILWHTETKGTLSVCICGFILLCSKSSRWFLLNHSFLCFQSFCFNFLSFQQF